MSRAKSSEPIECLQSSILRYVCLVILDFLFSSLSLCSFFLSRFLSYYLASICLYLSVYFRVSVFADKRFQLQASCLPWMKNPFSLLCVCLCVSVVEKLTHWTQRGGGLRFFSTAATEVEVRWIISDKVTFCSFSIWWDVLNHSAVFTLPCCASFGPSLSQRDVIIAALLLFNPQQNSSGCRFIKYQTMFIWSFRVSSAVEVITASLCGATIA